MHAVKRNVLAYTLVYCRSHQMKCNLLSKQNLHSFMSSKRNSPSSVPTTILSVSDKKPRKAMKLDPQTRGEIYNNPTHVLLYYNHCEILNSMDLTITISESNSSL